MTIPVIGSLCLHFEHARAIFAGKKNAELRRFRLSFGRWLPYPPRCSPKAEQFAPFLLRICEHLRFSSMDRMRSSLKKYSEIELGVCSDRVCLDFTYLHPVINIISCLALVEDANSITFPRGSQLVSSERMVPGRVSWSGIQSSASISKLELM